MGQKDATTKLIIYVFFKDKIHCPLCASYINFIYKNAVVRGSISIQLWPSPPEKMGVKGASLIPWD